MFQIELFLSSAQQPELTELRFTHSALGGSWLHATRGRCANGTGSTGSFYWTPGLHGLSILLLRAASELQRASVENRQLSAVAISGEALSAAAALDGALSKNATWISECFGNDANGTSTLRRILSRTNPERKRAGPVTIGISANSLRNSAIKVHTGSMACKETKELDALTAALEQQWVLQHPSRGSCFSSSDSKAQRHTNIALLPSDPHYTSHMPPASQLAPLFYESILSCLRGTDVFTPRGVKERYKHLASNSEFQRLSGGMQRLTLALDREKTTSARLGILSDDTDFRRKWGKDRPPLRILMPGSHVAAVALMEYMTFDEQYPFSLDYRYSHANEIVQVLLSGEEVQGVDACIVSLGQLARLLATKKALSFEPLMILPAVKLELLTPRDAPRSDTLNGSTVHLLHAGGSSSAIFLHEVIKATGSRQRQVTLQHAEPLSFADSLGQGEPNRHVVAWFPYTTMLQLKTGCRTRSFEQSSFKENFLLVSKRLMRDRAAMESLDLSIRNCWLSMIEEPQRVLTTVNRLLDSPAYRQALRRWVGWDRAQAANHQAANQ